MRWARYRRLEYCMKKKHDGSISWRLHVVRVERKVWSHPALKAALGELEITYYYDDCCCLFSRVVYLDEVI